MNFTDQEWLTIVSALRVAASVYRDDATMFKNSQHPTMFEQYDRQSTEAIQLAERIEENY
jgi:hypothetical protein